MPPKFEHKFREYLKAREQRIALEAQREAARKILHSGWCIPELETQVEDYIAAIDTELIKLNGGTSV